MARGRWPRPHRPREALAEASRAWLDLVLFSREKPALGIDLGEADGFPPDYELPKTVSVRVAELASHGDVFEPYLTGPFRALAEDQLGSASSMIEHARYGISVRGSLEDPADLAHIQAVRALAAFLARTAGGLCVANDLSLSWQDIRWMADAEPPAVLRIDEWIEVLHDPDVSALYTRGMAQFARPDLAILGQPPALLERAAQLLRHLAFLEAVGTSFAVEGTTRVLGPGASATERVTIALRPLPPELCEAIAIDRDSLAVEGWPNGLAEA